MGASLPRRASNEDRGDKGDTSNLLSKALYQSEEEGGGGGEGNEKYERAVNRRICMIPFLLPLEHQ